MTRMGFKSGLLGLVVVLAACTAPADESYVSQLQSVNPTSAAGGAALVTLDDDTLAVSGAFNNLEGDVLTQGGAHLHQRVSGGEDTTVLFLNVNANEDDQGVKDLRNGAFAGTLLEYTDATALESGSLYVDVHSQAYPQGELSGTLTRQP